MQMSGWNVRVVLESITWPKPVYTAVDKQDKLHEQIHVTSDFLQQTSSKGNTLSST